MEVRLAAGLVTRTQYLSITTSASRLSPSATVAQSKRTFRPLQAISCRTLSTESQVRPQAATGGTDADAAHKQSSTDASDLRVRRSTIPGLPMRRSDTNAPSSRRAGPGAKAHIEDGGSSYTDLLKESQAAPPRPSETLSSWGAPPRRDITPRTGARYTSLGMTFPNPLGGAEAASRQIASRPRVIRELDIHVKPRTGRTLRVDPQKKDDLGAKLQQLDMLCNRNQIRRDSNRQRFHERPGLKRKRLLSQRWQREFKTRFALMALRINDIRKQGW